MEVPICIIRYNIFQKAVIGKNTDYSGKVKGSRTDIVNSLNALGNLVYFPRSNCYGNALVRRSAAGIIGNQVKKIKTYASKMGNAFFGAFLRFVDKKNPLVSWKRKYTVDVIVKHGPFCNDV